MVIEKLKNKKSTTSEYYFEYTVENSRLTKLFWADPISRRNYIAFGDVVSFDATYSMNRYNMIFVPFTGVDCHYQSITFAAALISKEDADSYTWVLEAFLKCMDSAPKIVLTDQDPALRKVVPLVFPDCHHRYCIWHIMKKLSIKLGFTPEMNEFRTKLANLVYDEYITPSELEQQWPDLLQSYGMDGNSWLEYQYSLRTFWVPCFFSDILLGGLLRTTSRSESENSFFNGFMRQHKSLLGFFMGFDSALDSQRYSQSISDHATRTKNPFIETPLEVEVHAAEIYTLSVFKKVQAEILASSFKISVVHVQVAELITKYKFSDTRYTNRFFTVTHGPEEDEFECNCKYFLRVGQVCRHVFAVFRTVGITRLPTRYILKRWTKKAIAYANSALDHHFTQQCDLIPETSRTTTDLWMEFKACILMAADDKDKQQYIMEMLKQIQNHLSDQTANPTIGKNQIIASVLGSAQPIHGVEPNIKCPLSIHTKGSGKRLIGIDEQLAKQAKRHPRLCRSCNEYVLHDKRNCPQR